MLRVLILSLGSTKESCLIRDQALRLESSISPFQTSWLTPDTNIISLNFGFLSCNIGLVIVSTSWCHSKGLNKIMLVNT